MMRKLLMSAGAVGLLVVSRSGLAQIDIKAMSSVDGQCRAEIETRAVACHPFGTFWEFRNCRSLFAFVHEGTLYSFAGSRVQRSAGRGFTLTVDMVRIASQTTPERALTDVEGKCIVRTEADGIRFTVIECDSARRGQKAGYRFVLDRITNFQRKTTP